MKNNELAKKLLTGDIESEYAWIYELTNGIIKEENKGLKVILNNETSVRGFDLRIIRPNEIITADFHMKRINIELNNDSEIIRIYLG